MVRIFLATLGVHPALSQETVTTGLLGSSTESNTDLLDILLASLRVVHDELVFAVFVLGRPGHDVLRRDAADVDHLAVVLLEFFKLRKIISKAKDGIV